MKIPSVLIMAAGRGTRMRSRLPKVLHPLCGRPLMLWPVEAAREAGAERIVVVLGAGQRGRPARAAARTSRSRSRTRRPAPATRSLSARDALGGSERRDRALRRPPAARRRASSTALAERHAALGRGRHRHHARARGSRASTGAIVRAPDGDVERIVETKHPGDATPEELAIKEINAGTYAFAVEPLFDALDAGRHRQRPGRALPRRRAAAAARSRAQRGGAT